MVIMKRTLCAFILLLIFSSLGYCGMKEVLAKCFILGYSCLEACAGPLKNSNDLLDIDVNGDPKGEPLNVHINGPLSVELYGVPEMYKLILDGLIILSAATAVGTAVVITVGYPTYRLAKFGCDSIANLCSKCFTGYRSLDEERPAGSINRTD
jgi:hypothetical protein